MVESRSSRVLAVTVLLETECRTEDLNTSVTGWAVEGNLDDLRGSSGAAGRTRRIGESLDGEQTKDRVSYRVGREVVPVLSGLSTNQVGGLKESLSRSDGDGTRFWIGRCRPLVSLKVYSEGLTGDLRGLCGVPLEFPFRMVSRQDKGQKVVEESFWPEKVQTPSTEQVRTIKACNHDDLFLVSERTLSVYLGYVFETPPGLLCTSHPFSPPSLDSFCVSFAYLTSLWLLGGNLLLITEPHLVRVQTLLPRRRWPFRPRVTPVIEPSAPSLRLIRDNPSLIFHAWCGGYFGIKFTSGICVTTLSVLWFVIKMRCFYKIFVLNTSTPVTYRTETETTEVGFHCEWSVK